jgi:tetratricopeptide (TPR) repeat protein/tRNA A-37 threonylcarbamoyl transferase component Bud32
VNDTYLGPYQIVDEIGHGGMGAVYRAYDRLSGETVALKRILSAQHAADATSIGQSSELRISLAREFQVLASLHHPNIISVLDYGFDPERQPYFTMSLLEKPCTLREAGENQPLKTQMGLVIDMLQAITYLHRHGIVHRDLKPANVLVTASGEVKVLDFGLAAASGGTAESGGTLLYIAPEVLMGYSATHAADLYAVGIMIYELLAGHHPYNTSSTATLINDALHTKPDLSGLDVSDDVKRVIERLLSKDPDTRYNDAYQAIVDLCAAIGQPVPPESEAIRQSFLEAAKFVGREAELNLLMTALNSATEGRGSAWLIGGESGIGKSRLLDELRTQAVVNGVLVVRGQAVAEGGVPYQAWVDVVRRLVVTTDITDLEAGVLKAIVPDIAALMGRDVPDAPEVDAASGQQRLGLTVADVISRQPDPVLLLLEDLQWASESLDILRALNRVVDEVRLLIVATYRDDERPNLPEELPGMQVMKLERLAAPSIAELSTAMLGAGGGQAHVLELINRETEGNVFFLVEVLRALAEEAGGLGKIVDMTLPERVMAGGVQQVIRRRLGRAPQEAQPLLRLAAVAGRQLDLDVLRALMEASPDLRAMPLDDWLTACANAVILERQERTWRFAHDKLRELLVADLPDDLRPALHRQVAEAVERVYPDDDAQAAVLVEHWHEAGDQTKEAHYAVRAGNSAAARYAHNEALDYLSRALALLREDNLAQRYDLLLARVRIYHIQGFRPGQEHDLKDLEALAGQLGDDRRRAIAGLRRAELLEVTGDNNGAITAAQEAVRLAQAAGDAETEVEAAIEWGTALWKLADYPASRQQFEHTLEKAAPFPHLKAYCLRHLGVATARQADFQAAETFSQQALELFQELGDRIGESAALRSLGGSNYLRGNYARAREFYQQAMRRFHETGDKLGESAVLNNLGIVADDTGDYDAARDYVEQSLAIKRQIGEKQGEASCLVNLGFFAAAQGDYAAAGEYNRRALALLREIGDRQDEANVLNNQGVIAAAQGDYAAAQGHYQRALDIRQELDDEAGMSETLGFFGLLRHHQGEAGGALEYLNRAVAIARAVSAELEEARALYFLGRIQQAAGQLVAAEDSYRKSLALRDELGQTHLAIEPRAALAEVSLAQGGVGEAFNHINRVMQHLGDRTADGLDDPARLYLSTYRVLNQLDDRRALDVLDEGYYFVQVRANRMTDEDARQVYLDIAANRDLLAAWNEAHRL